MPEEQRLNPNRNLMIERRGTGSLIEHLASKLLMGVKKEMLLKRHNLKIVLCGVHYESDVMESIVKKSKSQIGQIHLPYVKNQRKQLRGEDRERLANINTNNPFERYLVDTLYYCMPKIMVEYFRNYYDAYLRDIQKKSFSHIVSEVWRSYFPTSIYVAIAQQEGKKLIFQQHGCSTQWTSCNPDWLEYSVADNYLTTGWVGDNKKIIRGGFACRNVRSYEYEKCKKDILYVGTNRLPYAYPFVGTANSSMINLFKIFRSFFELLPDRLRDHLLLRPRRAQYYCDTENIWSVKDNNIRTADGVFSDIIYESRIVIIDHLSTGLGEILSAGIPCMIIHDEHIEQLADEYFHIFDELKECGVVHNSALSAVNKLIEVYDDVEGWWKSEHLQNAHKEICGKTYGPASRTVDYLVSCIDS